MAMIHKLMQYIGQNGYTVGLQPSRHGYVINLLDPHRNRESSYGFAEKDASAIALRLAQQYCTQEQYVRLYSN